jgi:hypothetical protein
VFQQVNVSEAGFTRRRRHISSFYEQQNEIIQNLMEVGYGQCSACTNVTGRKPPQAPTLGNLQTALRHSPGLVPQPVSVLPSVLWLVVHSIIRSCSPTLCNHNILAWNTQHTTHIAAHMHIPYAGGSAALHRVRCSWWLDRCGRR